MRALGLLFVLTACAHEIPAAPEGDPTEAFFAWMSSSGKKSPVVFAFQSSEGHLTCGPHWKLLVRQDGTVEFEGANVRENGFSTWTMPVERIETIWKKASPLWTADLHEVHSYYAIYDASPACLSLNDGQRTMTKCFASRRDTLHTVADFAFYLAFKTNAVARIGERHEWCGGSY